MLKMIKQIKLIQLGYLVLGAFVVTKLLKSKDSTLIKNTGIIPLEFIFPVEETNQVKEIETPFTSNVVKNVQTFADPIKNIIPQNNGTNPFTNDFFN